MSKATTRSTGQARQPQGVIVSTLFSVGIDISKATFNVALYGMDKAGVERYLDHSFANNSEGIDAFQRLLQQQQALDVPLCMEATGRYWERLAHTLSEAGHTVCIVNPARLKAYVKALGAHAKTDKADARYIAHFCAKQNPDPWLPPTPDRRELQALSRHLQDLKQEQTRHRNRRDAEPPSVAVRKSLDEILQQLTKQIAEVEAEIERLSTHSAEFATPFTLLCSIPGIGAITAVRLLAEIPNVANFASVRQLTAYAGLNPSIRQSGMTTRKSSLSKQGNRHLRAALFYPAMSAMLHNPVVAPLATRMAENGKARMQCVAAAMRKLLHIVYGVLKSGKPFDPTLATTPGLT